MKLEQSSGHVNAHKSLAKPQQASKQARKRFMHALKSYDDGKTGL